MCEGRRITKFERLHQAAQVTRKDGNVAPAGARQAKFYLKWAMLYGYNFRGLPEEPRAAGAFGRVRSPR